MATIRDIAQAAGVSQGTASNVLNGKGNVSSEKIRLVQQAATAMGYTINEKARSLRKGSSQLLAVILPNLSVRPYADYYASFRSYCEADGYQVKLYTTDNIPDRERDAMLDIKANAMLGVATITSLPSAAHAYREDGFERHQVLFAERTPEEGAAAIGFDYTLGGEVLAKRALADGCKRLAIVGQATPYSNEVDFATGVERALAGGVVEGGVSATRHHFNFSCREKDYMQLFESTHPDGILLADLDLAATIQNVRDCFYPGHTLKIYTLSPVFTLPEGHYTKYELDYHFLGRSAAKQLITQLKTRQVRGQVLENAGLRVWVPSYIPAPGSRPLTILSMESPATKAMRYLSHLFTASTGIEVNIISFSYDELYEVLCGLGDSSMYDIVRLSSGWLPQVADSLLAPLDDIDPNIHTLFPDFLPGMLEEYARVQGKIYALPSTPSVQFLFYRKDILNDPVCRRLYYEKNRRELRLPQSFEEFNQLAAFFTKSLNPHSPVEHGSILTLESSSMAAVEFLTRYYSLADRLRHSDGSFSLHSPQGVQALSQLLELRNYAISNSSLTWHDTAACFAQGKAFMALLFNNYTSPLTDLDSQVVGRVGYTMVPGGKPMFSGGVFGVTKHSRSPEQALAFIKWACSETVATAMTMLGSVSPCNKTYQNHQVINSYPWLELTPGCFAHPHTNRIPARLAPHGNEKSFMGILGMAVKSAYRGASTAEEALAFAQRRLENL